MNYSETYFELDSEEATHCDHCHLICCVYIKGYVETVDTKRSKQCYCVLSRVSCLSIRRSKQAMPTKDNLNRIQMIQNRCIEIISRNKKLEESFKKLKILKIKELIKLQEIKVGYRLINKQLPNKISQQLQCDSNHRSLTKTHPYNTRRKNVPNLPKVTRSSYINSYLYQSIRQFMLLPLNIQKAPSISIFVTNYKRNYWT